MAELKNEEIEEDYLDNMLNSVSEPLPDDNKDNEEKESSDDLISQLLGDEMMDNVFDNNTESAVTEDEADNTEDNKSFDNDEDDIESLLNMLDTQGMDEDLKSEDIDKIAEELNDIPDLSEIEDRSSKKEKKKKKIFGRKKKKSSEDDIQNNDISPEDNEQIIKSVEDSFEDSFDLSDLAGLDDLEDIEERPGKTEQKHEEPTEDELKALEEEKKAEKERKKQEKAEKKAEKKRIKKEKKAARKEKRAEKKRKKENEKPKIPEEKIKVSIPVIMLLISVAAAVILISTFGGRYIWYSSHINDATDLLIDRKYTQAYDNIAGLKIKDKDKGLYRQLRTLMFIEKEYNSYENCIKIGMYNEALDSLLKGIEKYQTYKSDAEEYGVSEQASGIYENILAGLSKTFGLNEDAAKELAGIKDSQEYSRKISDIVKEHSSSINDTKNSLK